MKSRFRLRVGHFDGTPTHAIQGRNRATTSSKLGVQFLGLGYYYPSTEKNRQVYPVWCSRLHNQTIFIKSYVKNRGSVQMWGSGPPDPQWLGPWRQPRDLQWMMGLACFHQIIVMYTQENSQMSWLCARYICLYYYYYYCYYYYYYYYKCMIMCICELWICFAKNIDFSLMIGPIVWFMCN